MRQLPLPKLDIGKFVVKKYPQPKSVKKVAIKKFEILYHPFDLAFRGRINKWLVQFESGELWVVSRGKKTKDRLKKILDEKSSEVIRLYFYPQGKKRRWLNQDEVLEKTRVGNKRKLRRMLVESLVKFWSETKNLKAM